MLYISSSSTGTIRTSIKKYKKVQNIKKNFKILKSSKTKIKNQYTENWLFGEKCCT